MSQKNETLFDEDINILEFQKEINDKIKDPFNFSVLLLDFEPFDYQYDFLVDESDDIIVAAGRQCLEINEYVYTPTGIKKCSELKNGDEILGGIVTKYQTFEDDVYEVTFENGIKIKCNNQHPFYTQDGWMPIKKIEQKLHEKQKVACQFYPSSYFNINIDNVENLSSISTNPKQKEFLEWVENDDKSGQFIDFVSIEYKGRMTVSSWRTEGSNEIISYCGMRTHNCGKSEMTSIKAIHYAYCHEFSTILLISPSQRQSSLLFDKCRSHIGKSEFLKKMVTRETRTLLQFKNGSKIITLPAGHDGMNIRGYTADMIICFPYEQKVFTNNGYIPIGLIVEEQLKLSVLSFNYGKNKFEFKKIISYKKNLVKNTKIVVIRTNSGTLNCTIDHELFCVDNNNNYKGFVRSGDIRPGFKLIHIDINMNIIYDIVTDINVIETFDDLYVYDLGVSDTNNYIVENFLVHNCDEAAFIKDAVFQAIMPMISTTRSKGSGKLILISSPFGKRGKFYEYYVSKSKDTFLDFSKYHFPSTINPLISDEFLKSERERMTDMEFRTEYLAEFVDDADSFFTYDLIENCSKNIIMIGKMRMGGYKYYMGVDFAKERDSTVVTIIEIGPDGIKRVVYIEEFVGINYLDQIKMISAIHSRFNISRTVVDQSSVGETPLEIMRRSIRNVRGIKFNVNNKLALFNNLRVAMQNGDIHLPTAKSNVVVKLKNQLHSIQYKITSEGNIKIHHPRKQFDDFVDSLVLANEAAGVVRKNSKKLKPVFR